MCLINPIKMNLEAIWIKRGEVYYAAFENTAGSEQSGTRPCVILQNDIGNKHSPTVIVAPMSTKQKNNVPTHVETCAGDRNLFVGTKILMEQIRTVDKGRIGCFVCKLSRETMNRVDEALRISLGLE